MVDKVELATGNFVNYLPQDEAVASGLGADEGGLDPVESQRTVDLLNKELSRLLKLSPRDFWREVASDTSLHSFLESYLKFRSRWYDFPYHGAKGILAGVIVGEYELSRRVFMVLYRISSNKDPGAKTADSLSPNDHTVILQGKKLLDLPKLLDLCALYSHENQELTRLLVVNAINAQPWIHDDLTGVISHFLNVVNTMYHRCTSSLEVLSLFNIYCFFKSNIYPMVLEFLFFFLCWEICRFYFQFLIIKTMDLLAYISTI
jgi:activating signal cointegrator complex subunit 2